MTGIHQLFLGSPNSGIFSYEFDSSTSNDFQEPAPVNIYYRRHIVQTVYTASELSSYGARSGAKFVNLRWYITDPVPEFNSARGLNIRLFHTNTLDGTSDAFPISGESKTTVYFVDEISDVTEFETAGICQFNFITTFSWNGINNICVEICTSQNENDWLQRGTQRVVYVTNGSRYDETDSVGSSCSDSLSAIIDFKPSVEMDFVF